VKETVKIVGFVLVAVGTLGLLAAEYLFNDVDSTTCTILFAVFNVVGLAVLAYSHRFSKKRE
jgi:hypothetical protein